MAGLFRPTLEAGADSDRSRAARREVNLRRGFLRLGAGATALWFVFWTFAYVLKPRVSENAPSLPALSLTTDIALIVAGVLVLPWVVSGFRPN